jgi:hypothetical protein
MVDFALDTKLRRARRYWALLDGLAGAGWLLAALLLAALLCFHLDRLLVLSPAARVAWRFAGAALLVGGALALGAAALLRRRSDEVVAARVERRYPELGERLLSTVELAHAPEGHRAGLSPGMIGALAQETSRAALPLRFEAAFGLNGLAIAGGAAALAVALLLLHQALFPEAMASWWQRMARPYAGVPVYRSTRVQVEPREAVLLRGGSLAVRVGTEGRPVREARVKFRFGDGPWSTVRLTRAPFVHRFAGLTEPVSFYATAGDGQSDVGHARVVDPPAVVNVALLMRYPSYMRRPEERLSGPSGALQAPAGTRVAVRLTANKPLRSAELRLGGRSLGAWSVDGASAGGGFVVTRDTSYGFRLRDTDGFENALAIEYPIRAVPDATPEVRIERPTGDRELVANGSLPLEGEARDDYGVNTLRLAYRVERQTPLPQPLSPRGREGKSGSKETGSPHLTLAQGGPRVRSVPASVRWNLGALALKPGDAVRYRLEADDFDTLTGPHVGRSVEYRIHVVDPQEMEQRLAEQREELQRLLERLITEQREARAQVAALQRQRASPESIAAAESRQRALAQQAAEAAARLRELSQALENNRMASEQELAAQAQAQQALSQLAQQAMPQAADRMAAARNAADPRQELAEAMRQQEEILRQMEQLRRGVSPMDDLARLAAWAERLAQVELELRRRTERLLPGTLGLSRSELPRDARATLDGLAQQQTLARQSAEQLHDRIASTAERLKATDPNAAGLAQEAAQQMQELAITERQGETEERLKANALASAATQAGALARDLQRIAEGLNPNRVATGLQNAVRRQLQRALQQLQQMMRAQAEISRRTAQHPDPATAADLARQERALQQQAQRLAQALARMTEQTPEAGEAAESLRQAAERLARAGGQLSRNSPGQAQPQQQQAQSAMEQAAQALQEALNDRMDDRQREALRRQLQHLAVRQRAVNTALRRMGEQGDEANRDESAREMEQLAGKQGEIGGAAGGLQQRLPSRLFRETMQEARSAMGRVQQRLQQHDPGAPARQSGEQAARMLEEMAQAMESDESAAGGGAGGGGAGSGGGRGAARDLQRTLADLRLLRALEQGIRGETEELNGRPSEDASRGEAVDSLAGRQSNTRERTGRAARSLQRFGNLGQRVGEASEFMGESQGELQRRSTGEAAQQAQENAIRRLSQAIQQAQQMARQMGSGQGRQGRQPRPGKQQGGRNGTTPAIESAPRLGTGAGGARSLIGPGGRGFGPLSPREQRSLREGWGEKIPPDYADLIQQYYRSLSNQRR